MKKILVILMCAVMMVGCGGQSTSSANDGESVEKEFDIDVDTLEQDGYVRLSGIAYGKIEGNEDNPRVRLVYYQNAPELAFYLMVSIVEGLNTGMSFNFPDFVIDWNGENYELGDNLPDDITEEEMFDYFPSEWRVVLESALKGGGVDSLVSKQSADIIDEDVKEFVSEYKNETENSSNSGEQTEANETDYTVKDETDLEVLANEIYNIGEDEFRFGLTQSGQEYSVSLFCTIKDKSDAFGTHIALNSMMNSDDEDIKKLMDLINLSYTISIGDGTSLINTGIAVLLMSDDESFLPLEEYFSTDWLVNESRESDYGTQVIGFLGDFIENN